MSYAGFLAVGGFLMGLAMGLIAQFDALPPAVRLLFMTGFLGGLTTFSTFYAVVPAEFGAID